MVIKKQTSPDFISLNRESMQKDYSFWIIPIYSCPDGWFEFLLIHQKSYGWAFWWFPKGHAEGKEDGITAAKREFFEEVGIKNISVKKDKQRSFNYQFWQKGIQYDKKVTYRIGFVKDKATHIQEEELEDCAWLDYAAAKEKLSHENMKDIFEEVAKGLGIK